MKQRAKIRDGLDLQSGAWYLSSWTFWFNQDGQEAIGSTDRLVNSFVPGDWVPDLMGWNDLLVSTFYDTIPHRWYELPTRQRVPVDDGVGTGDPNNRPDLAIEIPALVDNRLVADCADGMVAGAVVPLLGQVPSPLNEAQAINADGHGWREDAHSDWDELPLPSIWPWYGELFIGHPPLFLDPVLPREEE